MDVIHDYGYINRDIATDEYVEQVGNEAYWDNPTFKSLSTEEQKKLDAEYKMLQNLIDTVVNRIDVDAMTTDQKLKLLQLSLHYVLPKLRSTETTEKKYDDEPIFIEVVERKKDAEESENWADNFEVTEVHRIDPVSSKVS